MTQFGLFGPKWLCVDCREGPIPIAAPCPACGLPVSAAPGEGSRRGAVYVPRRRWPGHPYPIHELPPSTDADCGRRHCRYTGSCDHDPITDLELWVDQNG